MIDRKKLLLNDLQKRAQRRSRTDLLERSDSSPRCPMSVDDAAPGIRREAEAQAERTARNFEDWRRTRLPRPRRAMGAELRLRLRLSRKTTNSNSTRPKSPAPDSERLQAARDEHPRFTSAPWHPDAQTDRDYLLR